MSHRPPWLPANEVWVTVSEAAQVWGRNVRVIQNWCTDGTFTSSRVRIHFDSTAAGRGQWWICLPPEIVAKRTERS